MQIQLSDKSIKELSELLNAFFDGEDSTDLVAQTLQGEFVFEVWDALGCDDLDLVSQNKELQKLYKNLFKQYQQALKSKTTRH